MRKILFLISFLFFGKTQAQVTIPALTDKAFQRYDIILSTVVSISYPYAEAPQYAHRNGAQVPFSTYLDFGVHENLSIGIFGGINQRFYKYAPPMNDEILFTTNHYTAGLRAGFHFLPMLEKAMDVDMNSNRLDVYLSPALGYRYTEYVNIGFAEETKIVGGLTVGARYYVWGGLALVAEAGYGIFGYGNTGLSFRF
jgi:hypothetical protein